MTPAKPTSARTSSWFPSGLMLAGCVALLLGERMLGQGQGRVLLSGLSAVLLAAGVALRGQALVSASGDVRRAEGFLLVAQVALLLGLGLYGLTTDGGLDALGLQDAARTRASGALTVLWLAVVTVAGAATLFMELAYARMPVARSVELRRLRLALQAGLTLSLAVVFWFAMNFVASERDVRKDVSYFKTTKPSDGTISAVKRLDAPLSAILFFQRGDEVLERVRPYFDTVAAASPNFSVEVVDFDFAPELARKHKVRGNGHVLLVRGEGDEQRGQSIRIGESLTSARGNLRKLDGLFQQHFAKLVQTERKVYLTVGHAERNMRSEGAGPGDGVRAMQSILTRLNLEPENLGLADGLGSAVPDGSSAVIVMGPRESFLREEAEVLLEYVRKGGRVLLMLDPNVDDGLEPLMRGLGLERLPGVVASTDRHIRRTYSKSDRALVVSNSYSSHPTTTTASRHSNELASAFVQGVATHRIATWGKLSPRPKVVFPIRSKGTFFRDLDGDFEMGEGEPKETLNLMATVAVSPLSAGDASDGANQEQAPEGRLVVIGDGDFMTDKLATNNGNLVVFVDALAWLIGNEELIADVESEEDVKIEHTREEDKLWFYGTTFAVPVPIVFVGLWVARRRRRLSEVKA